MFGWCKNFDCCLKKNNIMGIPNWIFKCFQKFICNLMLRIYILHHKLKLPSKIATMAQSKIWHHWSDTAIKSATCIGECKPRQHREVMLAFSSYFQILTLISFAYNLKLEKGRKDLTFFIYFKTYKHIISREGQTT